MMKLNLQYFGGRGSAGSRGGASSKVSPSEFGKAGVYEVYRAGDIFDSPLGFLSFGVDKRQSEAYSDMKSMPIESYEVTIKNPYVLKGSDFDTMQERLTKNLTGKSFTEGATLKEQQAIMKQASEKLAKQGYDSILMDRFNRLSGKHTYEVDLLNSKKAQAKKRR